MVLVGPASRRSGPAGRRSHRAPHLSPLRPAGAGARHFPRRPRTGAADSSC